MSKFQPPGNCPVCGQPVPEGASSCKECGACPHTGWSDETLYDGLDLPETTEEAKKPSLYSEYPSAPKGPARFSSLTLVIVVGLVGMLLWIMFPF